MLSGIAQDFTLVKYIIYNMYVNIHRSSCCIILYQYESLSHMFSGFHFGISVTLSPCKTNNYHVGDVLMLCYNSVTDLDIML
jgi:hypothetical protein